MRELPAASRSNRIFSISVSGKSKGMSLLTTAIHPPCLSNGHGEVRTNFVQVERERWNGRMAECCHPSRTRGGIGGSSKIRPLDVDGSDPTDILPAVTKAEPVSHLGDVWTLGRHRLLCDNARIKPVTPH